MAYLLTRSIVIDHTKCGSADSSDYVLGFIGTYSYLASLGFGGHLRSSTGLDIGWFSDSLLTTRLDHELEYYVATTGEIVAWIRIPTLSHSADTTIYMGYGDTGTITDQSNKHGVWVNDGAGTGWDVVLHLGDGTNALKDSTVNAYDATAFGTPGTVSGPFGKARSLNGSTQYFSADGIFLHIVNSVTMSMLFYPTSISVAGELMHRRPNFVNYAITVDSTGHPGGGANIRDFAQVVSTAAMTLNAWNLIHVGYDHGTGDFFVFVNGTKTVHNVGSSAGGYTGTGACFFGSDADPTATIPGRIKECRVTTTVATQSFVTSENNNLLSPSTFYAISAVLSGSDPGPEGLTINGSLVNFKDETLEIAATTNGVDTLRCMVVSIPGTYRPRNFNSISFVYNSIRRFGGFIQSTLEQGLGGFGVKPITTDLSAVDYSRYVSNKFVKVTLPAGSLLDALTTIVTYFSDLGITLDSGQAAGPSLEEQVYDYRKGSEILDELANLSGWVWNIDYFGILSMIEPGTVAAPFDVVEGDIIDGDLEIEPSVANYANRVIAVVAPRAVVDFQDNYVGDGSTTVFALSAKTTIGQTRGYVTCNAVNETLGLSGATWILDETLGTITRSSAPGAGQLINITYNGTYTATSIADDAVLQAADGIIEFLLRAPEDTSSQAQLDALSSSTLLQKKAKPKVAKYKTFSDGLEPGQTQHILSTLRDTDADFLITDVRLVNFSGNLLRWEVTAVEGNVYQGGWADTYRLWNGSSVATGA